MAIKIPIVTVFDNKGLKNAQSAIGKIGAGIKGAFKVAAGAAAAVGALTAVGVAFAKAGEQASTSNARITQIAESMGLFGTEAGAVSKRLQDLAKDTALLTGMDINSIKATQAKLLTFKEIASTADDTGGAFDRATQAAIDLAAAGFGQAETNAVQLGKALNDPIKGITALTRSGVTFTQVERDKIKALTESGQILAAQEMILGAIETQVGGTAEATANASDKMAQSFQIMKEEIGTALEPMFTQLTKLISTALTPIAQALTPIFTTLFAALVPIIEQALPIFVDILNSLTPIIETLLNSMQPLLEALSPLFDVFILLATALAPLVEQIMPILVSIIQILAPIIASLVEAFIPLVEALLPPLLELFTALIPLIQLMATFLTDYLLPVFMALIEAALPPLIALIQGLTQGINWLTEFLGPLFAAIKPVLDALMRFAGIKPGSLNKRINVTAAIDANAARVMGMQVPGGGAVVSTPAITPINFTSPGGGGAGGETRQQKAARLERERLKKREEAFKSFAESVKQTFTQIKDSIMSSFDLPSLGNSVNSITRNIGKLLEKTKSFASNIGKLSGLGLNPQLLQQIIQAGPQAGAQLAAALVSGGSSAIAGINTSFNEFGELASGIAGIGTQAAFSGQQTVNNYSVSVTGGLATGADVGRAVVNAIATYERQSGAAWRA
jgi:hypothetical protein